MENDFFDTQSYLDMLRIKDEYTSKIEELSNDINSMINTKNEETGKKLKDALMKNFSVEELRFLKAYSQHSFIGHYDESNKTINYTINITDYIVEKYVNEFKGQGKIHRGANYSIYLKCRYHLIDKKFTVSLDKNGLYLLIRDTTLRESNFIMLDEIESLFKGQNIFTHELQNKFSEIKKIIDNWEGYYVTLKLKEN